MPKKILLVEDEAIIAMSEAQMLEKHGFEVSTVHSGEKAVKAVASEPDISLILMDIDLGKGMDGTEAAEKILETRDLPVVFASMLGYSPEEIYLVNFSQLTHPEDVEMSVDQMKSMLDGKSDLLLRSAPTPILVVQDGKYVYSSPHYRP